MEDKKISFFSRIKIAVTKLEDYGIFLEEKTSNHIKYFFVIVLILVVVMAIIETCGMVKVFNKGYHYIKNELPEFSYSDGNLEFSENVQAYDEEYDLYLIADTSPNISDEQISEYTDVIKSSGAILLKDKIIYQSNGSKIEYSYADLSARYNLQSIDKNQLIQDVENIGMVGISVTIFLILVIGIYIAQIISVFMDWVMMSIFAIFTARICRINMNFKQGFHLSIYALTLSLILSMIYNIAYYLTGFYTEYFRLIYILIAYVYIVAVILMIKSDLIKQQIEVSKVVEIQKDVHKELKNNEEEEKQDKKREKKEKDENQDNTPEPDGSEI